MLSLVVLVICLLVANFSNASRTSGLFMSLPCKPFTLRIGALGLMFKLSKKVDVINTSLAFLSFSTRTASRCACLAPASGIRASSSATPVPSAPSSGSVNTSGRTPPFRSIAAVISVIVGADSAS